ncbi:MAG: DnaJ domain-containing protein [Spirochaetaceae bacterium]|nr:DnaJ domain-containing protein [Spirochaetaceae bacterium]MDT8299553.1 DnaJ domain-containing protein [Spirochaetaceae bacterium]
MKDYYAILGLKTDSRDNDIRKAFRVRAKQMHPDRTGDEGTARFLALKEAYEVLINTDTRESYDRTWRAARKTATTAEWDYRDFLRGHKDDPASLARLICYDLLHDLDSEAVELYDEAQTGGFFSLVRFLDREDFMDYAFLLAEAYLEREATVKAYRLLRGIAELEEEDPYFKHFYVEVLDRMAGIVRQSLPDDEDNRLRMAFLTDLVKLSYAPKEEARLRKLLSELLAAAGDQESAAREIFKAYNLAPKLPGLAETVKVLKDLGFG